MAARGHVTNLCYWIKYFAVPDSSSAVKMSSRMLTGYRVDMWRTWEFGYRNADHWTGPITVGSFSHPNADAGFRELAVAVAPNGEPFADAQAFLSHVLG